MPSFSGTTTSFCSRLVEKRQKLRAALECVKESSLKIHAGLDAWSLAVDEAYGFLAVAPLTSLVLASPPRCLCPAPGANHGLLVTANGKLLYFNTTGNHAEEFVR